MSTPYSGLQEQLEKLNDLKTQGLLSNEEHAYGIKNILSSFGLGDANVTMSGDGNGTNGTGTGDFFTDDNDRGKHVEILIHNITHSDMALSINKSNLSLPLGKLIARPKFGEYRDISERLLQVLHTKSSSETCTIKSPVYSRSQTPTRDGRYPIAEQPRVYGQGQGHGEQGQHVLLPLGFDLSKCPVSVKVSSLHFKGSSSSVLSDAAVLNLEDEEEEEVMKNFYFQRSSWRQRKAGTSASVSAGGSSDGTNTNGTGTATAYYDDSPKVGNNSSTYNSYSHTLTSTSSMCDVNAIYFPLLSVLIHKWLETLANNGQMENSRKIVILISGRGTPTDPKARSIDNSTQATSKIVQRLISIEYPDLQIITLHSTTNLFRYDENIVFVKRELAPIVDHIRNDLAHNVGEKWKEYMGVTLSFADGSSARVSAINQSLSHYRPSYMHFWQLKTFWAEGKLCDDDIEAHDFADISTQPALTVEQTSSTVRMTVAAMQQFRNEFECIMDTSSTTNTDLAKFWLRKSKKPVLAVLLVQKAGSAPKLYRGTNMEVSMPTGSLCAERNVIGSALADDITLRRQDLKMIAVYSARSLDTPKPSSCSISMTNSTFASNTNYIHDVFNERQQYMRSNSSANSGNVDTNAKVTSFSTECLPCSGHNSSSDNGGSDRNTTSSAMKSGDVSLPTLHVNINLGNPHPQEQGHENAPQPTAFTSRQTKRSWFETSADSTSYFENGSPGSGGPNGAPRSPVIQGQKRKILRMPSNFIVVGSNKPKTPNSGDNRAHGFASSSSSSSNHNGYHNLDGNGNGNNYFGRKNTPLLRKIHSSFSSGGLLGLDRHEIFNMGDEYEPEDAEGEGQDGDNDEFGNNFDDGTFQGATKSRSFIVHEGDMNPLKPCGACLEWLKKISSVNPGFQVITFTDYQCKGVYQEIIADT